MQMQAQTHNIKNHNNIKSNTKVKHNNDFYDGYQVMITSNTTTNINNNSNNISPNNNILWSLPSSQSYGGTAQNYSSINDFSVNDGNDKIYHHQQQQEQSNYVQSNHQQQNKHQNNFAQSLIHHSYRRLSHQPEQLQQSTHQHIQIYEQHRQYLDQQQHQQQQSPSKQQASNNNNQDSNSILFKLSEKDDDEDYPGSITKFHSTAQVESLNGTATQSISIKSKTLSSSNSINYKYDPIVGYNKSNKEKLITNNFSNFGHNINKLPNQQQPQQSQSQSQSQTKYQEFAHKISKMFKIDLKQLKQVYQTMITDSKQSSINRHYDDYCSKSSQASFSKQTESQMMKRLFAYAMKIKQSHSQLKGMINTIDTKLLSSQPRSHASTTANDNVNNSLHFVFAQQQQPQQNTPTSSKQNYLQSSPLSHQQSPHFNNQQQQLQQQPTKRFQQSDNSRPISLCEELQQHNFNTMGTTCGKSSFNTKEHNNQNNNNNIRQQHHHQHRHKQQKSQNQSSSTQFIMSNMDSKKTIHATKSQLFQNNYQHENDGVATSQNTINSYTTPTNEVNKVKIKNNKKTTRRRLQTVQKIKNITQELERLKKNLQQNGDDDLQSQSQLLQQPSYIQTFLSPLQLQKQQQQQGSRLRYYNKQQQKQSNKQLINNNKFDHIESLARQIPLTVSVREKQQVINSAVSGSFTYLKSYEQIIPEQQFKQTKQMIQKTIRASTVSINSNDKRSMNSIKDSEHIQHHQQQSIQTYPHQHQQQQQSYGKIKFKSPIKKSSFSRQKMWKNIMQKQKQNKNLNESSNRIEQSSPLKNQKKSYSKDSKDSKYSKDSLQNEMYSDQNYSVSKLTNLERIKPSKKPMINKSSKAVKKMAMRGGRLVSVHEQESLQKQQPHAQQQSVLFNIQNSSHSNAKPFSHHPHPTPAPDPPSNKTIIRALSSSQMLLGSSTISAKSPPVKNSQFSQPQPQQIFPFTPKSSIPYHYQNSNNHFSTNTTHYPTYFSQNQHQTYTTKVVNPSQQNEVINSSKHHFQGKNAGGNISRSRVAPYVSFNKQSSSRSPSQSPSLSRSHSHSHQKSNKSTSSLNQKRNISITFNNNPATTRHTHQNNHLHSFLPVATNTVKTNFMPASIHPRRPNSATGNTVQTRSKLSQSQLLSPSSSSSVIMQKFRSNVNVKNQNANSTKLRTSTVSASAASASAIQPHFQAAQPITLPPSNQRPPIAPKRPQPSIQSQNNNTSHNQAVFMTGSKGIGNSSLYNVFVQSNQKSGQSQNSSHSHHHQNNKNINYSFNQYQSTTTLKQQVDQYRPPKTYTLGHLLTESSPIRLNNKAQQKHVHFNESPRGFGTGSGSGSATLFYYPNPINHNGNNVDNKPDDQAMFSSSVHPRPDLMLDSITPSFGSGTNRYVVGQEQYSNDNGHHGQQQKNDNINSSQYAMSSQVSQHNRLSYHPYQRSQQSSRRSRQRSQSRQRSISRQSSTSKKRQGINVLSKKNNGKKHLYQSQFLKICTTQGVID